MGNRKPGRRANATGRSKGDDFHLRLFHWELKSPAYRSLGLAARATYVELLYRFNGYNNGAIVLSVRQLAASLRVAPGTAHKALRELEDRGFIKPAQRGSFTLKACHATTWRLTGRSNPDQIATRDFLRWDAAAAEKFRTRSQRVTPTVSSADTEATAEEAKTALTVSKGDTEKPSQKRPTVSGSGTHLDYQGGCSENAGGAEASAAARARKR